MKTIRSISVNELHRICGGTSDCVLPDESREEALMRTGLGKPPEKKDPRASKW
jgi:hypothetical protein